MSCFELSHNSKREKEVCCVFQFRPLLLHLAVNASEQTFLPAFECSPICHLMLLYKLTSFLCEDLLPPSLTEHALFASWTLFGVGRGEGERIFILHHLPPHPTFSALLTPCKLHSFCTPTECLVGASDTASLLLPSN